MSGLLDLLAKFLEHAFSWLPRPEMVPRTQALIRWTFKKAPVNLHGIVWIIPLFHAYEKIDLRAEACEFEPKVLWTKDGHEAAVGMTVIWKVSDPLLLCETVDDIDNLVSKIGEAVLPELVGKWPLADLKRKATGGEEREWGFDTHLKRALETILNPYGITVELARLNFTSDRVRTFKLISSS